MDNTETAKTENQAQPEGEKKVVKKIVKKTNESATTKETTKPPVQSSAAAQRDRAKTMNTDKVGLFDKKTPASSNAVSGRKESKPIATIGSDTFKNRLSIFDKGNGVGPVQSKEDPGPKKLDPSKFGNFEQDNNIKTSTGGNATSGTVTGGIQAKLNAYLENARNRSKTVAHIDPILYKVKEKDKDDDQEEKGEEEANKDSGDELNISAGEEEKKEEVKESKNVLSESDSLSSSEDSGNIEIFIILDSESLSSMDFKRQVK